MILTRSPILPQCRSPSGKTNLEDPWADRLSKTRLLFLAATTAGATASPAKDVIMYRRPRNWTEILPTPASLRPSTKSTTHILQPLRFTPLTPVVRQVSEIPSNATPRAVQSLPQPTERNPERSELELLSRATRSLPCSSIRPC